MRRRKAENNNPGIIQVHAAHIDGWHCSYPDGTSVSRHEGQHSKAIPLFSPQSHGWQNTTERFALHISAGAFLNPFGIFLLFLP